MQAAELSVPPDMLRQLEMFTTFATQGQDMMGLIQELLRRTDVLGQAVTPIPVELSTHVTEQTRQSIDLQMAGLQAVHDSMAVRDEDVKARLNRLEADVNQLLLDMEACKQVCVQVDRVAAGLQAARVQLDGTVAMCHTLKQSISGLHTSVGRTSR